MPDQEDVVTTERIAAVDDKVWRVWVSVMMMAPGSRGVDAGATFSVCCSSGDDATMGNSRPTPACKQNPMLRFEFGAEGPRLLNEDAV